MTKAQKEYAAQFFKNNPSVKELHLNNRGEWFTDLNFANNSIRGEKDGKIETVKTGQKLEADEAK